MINNENKPLFEIVKDSFKNDRDFAEACMKILSIRAGVEAQDTVKTLGYIYFIFSEKYVKIGSTENDPLKRFQQLSVGNPNMIYLGAVKLENFRLKEKQLHEQLARLRYKGEWFKMSLKKAKSLLKELKENFNLMN